jgi:MFS family permease
MYKKSFEKNPMFDKEKYEVKLSFICSIIFIISIVSLNQCNEISNLTEVLKNLLLYIGAGLISMLGFIISGLAIASGTISNKMAYQIDKKGRFDSILSILFSFYYIGRIIGILIASYFISYVFISVSLPLYNILYYVGGVILAYGFFFVIFYSVSLLETCINLFTLSYKYWRESDSEENSSETNILAEFNSARVDALVSILFKEDIIEDKESYLNEIENIINENYQENLRERLIKEANNYYK